jgi:flavodoxin
MSKVFNHTQSSPFIWIKGFEPDDYYDVWEKNNALAYKDDVFPCIGSDFSFSWDVPVTYQRNKFNQHKQTIRHCKAFVKETDKVKLEKMPFRNYGKNQLIQNSIADITENLNEKDNVIILTSALNKKLLQNPVQLSKIKIWEEELEIANNKKCSMKDSLHLLEKLSAENIYTEIYFTPFGLEDEGILLDEFLDKEYAAKMNAVVYRPLDFINLKQQII